MMAENLVQLHKIRLFACGLECTMEKCALRLYKLALATDAT